MRKGKAATEVGTPRQNHPMTNQCPPKRKLTDDEKLSVFMDSFHAMSQKSYWPQLRAQGRVDIAGAMEMRVDTDSGRVAMRKSPLDPALTDLAGAYMRKLLTGTDLVSIGNLLNILKRKFGRSIHYDEARSVWKQAEDRKIKFLADGDRLTTFKVEFPPEWTKGRPRDQGERREVSLSIADFATPYFYAGFLHDYDEDKDTPTRRLAGSAPPVVRERMAHLAIATSLYFCIIAHHIIRTGRPELCPSECQEAAIMASLRGE